MPKGSPLQQTEPRQLRFEVLIVAYGRTPTLDMCLNSLRSAGWTSPITIIDNGYADGLPCLLSDDEQTRVLAPRSNDGFAAGVNFGAEKSTADMIWVLNPDAFVDTKVVASVLQSRPGFLGTHTVVIADTVEHEISIGRYNLLTARLEALDCTRRWHTPFVTGASFVVQRDILRTQPLCECFFLYVEDVEWSSRVGKGLAIRLLDGVIEHQTGSTGGSARMPQDNFLFHSARNRLWLIRRTRAPLVLLPILGAFIESLRFCLIVLIRSRSLQQLRSALSSSLRGTVEGLKAPVASPSCPIHGTAGGDQ